MDTTEGDRGLKIALATEGDVDEDAELAVELAKEYEESHDAKEVSHKKSVGLFEALYEAYPTETARKMSRKERDRTRQSSPVLTYGEINYIPFSKMWARLYAHGLKLKGGVFLDIGCGTGRPVFAAALLHDFSMCIGIEILSSLCGTAELVHNTWRKSIKFQCSKYKQECDIRFYHGDATVLDWHSADVIFANSTCFTPELMQKLATKAEVLKKGTIFVTATNPLVSEVYEMMEEYRMPETWGSATIFIHRRK